MTQISIQPNQDSYVYWYSATDQTTNYGAANILYMSAFAAAYVKFALTAIPVGSIINSATFNATVGNTTWSVPEDYVEIFPLTADWAEMTVTYANRPPQGPRYYYVPYAGVTYNQYQVMPLDVTTLVRDWYNSTIPNFGMALGHGEYPGGGPDGWGFYARESAYPPTITVDYTVLEEGTASFTGTATTSSNNVRVLETSSASTGTVTASLAPSAILGGMETVTGRSTGSVVPVRVIPVAQQATGTASITASSSRLVGGTMELTGGAGTAFESVPQKDGTLSATGLSSFTANGNQITGNRSAAMTATATISWDTTRLVDAAATCNAALLTTMSADRVTHGIMAAVGSAGIEGRGVTIMVADVAFVGRAAPSIRLLVYHWAEREKPPNPWRYKL